MDIGSPYDPEEEEALEVSRGKNAITYSEVSIAGPMAFWIILLMLAFVSKVFANVNVANSSPALYYIFYHYYYFIMFAPGIFILPLIVGALIGRSVGINSNDFASAMKASLIDGAYASIVYVIAVFIIYEMMIYFTGLPAWSVMQVAVNLIAEPIIVLIAVILVLAALAYSKMNGA